MSGRLPLRLRVAMAFAVTAALALCGLGAFVYYRVDATLMEQTRASLDTRMAALAQVSRDGRAAAVEAGSGESFSQILSPAGEVVASSPQVRGAVVAAEQLPAPGGRVTYQHPVRLVEEDESERALLLVHREGGQVLVVGTSLEDVEDALGGLLAQLLVGVPVALALASWLGYLVAGAALRPIERMREQAATISARSSGDRLPLPVAHDEIHRLGLTLNAMLDRLESALHRQRRFVAEASHELRTPLALLRMELDLALSRPRSHDELLAAVRSASEEVARLTGLSEDLLVLANAEEHRLVLEESELDLAELVESVGARFATTAGTLGRTIRVAAPGPVPVRADRARLDQVLSNLLDNALRHGAGDVEVAVEAGADTVLVRVADQGDGPPADLEGRAFDPFARGGASSGGRGLGLSIVRAVVAEHGGTVRFDPPSATGGTVVTVELPRRRAAARRTAEGRPAG